MEITDVRIRLANDSTDRLKAYCSITLDDEFVIRDLKIVDGVSGLFVAMPSRKSTIGCPRCHHKSPIRSRFCNDCGANLPPAPAQPVDGPRGKAHRDIAHPITAEYREYVQDRVLAAFKAECRLAAQPDYEPQTLDEDDEEVVDAAPPPPPRRGRGGRGRSVEQVEAVAAEETPVDPINDYDALIAGLKGGSGPGRGRGPAPENRSSAPPQPRPPQQPQRGRGASQPQPQRIQEPQGQQRPRQGSSGHDDHRGRGDGRHQGGRDRGGRGDQRGDDRSHDRGRHQRGGQRGDGGHMPQPQERETITNVASAPVSHVAEPQRIEPVRVEAPRPIPVVARVAPPPPPPPPAPVEDVDDTPFGEGIL